MPLIPYHISEKITPMWFECVLATVSDEIVEIVTMTPWQAAHVTGKPICAYTVLYKCTHSTVQMYTQYCTNVHTVLYKCTHSTVQMYTQYCTNVHTVLYIYLHSTVHIYTKYWTYDDFHPGRRMAYAHFKFDGKLSFFVIC